MILFMRISGILVAAAGIAAVGFGIPINEFNLGNTLIVAGTVAIAAGMILFGLSAAVDQLTQIAEALRPRAGNRPGVQPQAAEVSPAAARLGPVPGPVSGPAGPLPLPAKVPMPSPSRAPVFAKPRPEEFVPEPAVAESASEVSSSAIERLRSSMGRPDLRAGEPSADAEDVPYAAPAAGPRPGTNQGANGAAPSVGAGAGEARKKPPLDFLFRSKGREPQPEAFDAVWPKRGRHADEEADADEPVRPAAAEAPIERPYPSSNPPASGNDEVRPAAILKSGVVDGMAYTLYADGSIEAQLPQGTVRFGSIAELRSHIENNS